MLEIMLSLLSFSKDAYDFISDIRRGDPNKEVAAQLEKLNQNIVRLRDHILYAPSLQLVQDTTTNRQHVLTDLREVRQSLEPVQQVVNDDILASAMILTPDKMKQALQSDPWDVLMEIHPLNLARPYSNSSMVPILFEREGIRYVGWQTRGALPILFNCEYNPELNLILPRKPGLVTPLTSTGSVSTSVSHRLSPKSPIAFDWVTIPAGEFIIGNDNPLHKINIRLDDNSGLPQHRLCLPKFRIALVPVTVMQFAHFVKVTNYKISAEKRGSAWNWQKVKGKREKVEIKGAYWADPSGSRSVVNQRANHPVTCVSWRDAVAFCAWAKVRLPTEDEWEKAARGTEGRLYPWGNEAPNQTLCNFNDNVGDTTAVGSYPKGTSLYGCLDMAGNVWEWTNTKWYDDAAAVMMTSSAALRRDGTRVLRGNSFISNTFKMTSAYRDYYYPDFRSNDIGFRVAWSPG